MLKDYKNKIKNKLKENKIFKKLFSFEEGIDITNDDAVLYRKNKVVKNIIFISNLLFTLIFTIISASTGEASNWVLTIILFPVTFFINVTLKKLIAKGPNDHIRQVLAMYVSCLYMFIIGVILYVKLKYGYTGSENFLAESGYIILYYSLAICAYYQDKNMLKNVFVVAFIAITIIHFTVTYPIVTADVATDVSKIGTFFASNAFKDIIIRTILLALYMIILYAMVEMSNYMQLERKKELIKRREVQEEFTNIVTKIFDVTLDTKSINEEDKKNIEIVSVMSKKLASYLGEVPDACDRIYDFARLQITQEVDFDASKYESEDDKFEALRTQTNLGSELISRIQLSRKAEDLIRAVFDDAVNDDFVSKMNDIQNNRESNIILTCDIYVIMRSFKPYKRPYNHKTTINYMDEHFKLFLDPVVYDRFKKFDAEFEEVYDNM